MSKTNYTTIEEYINDCPKEIQSMLQQVRQIIIKVAPDATEKISYGMPTFFQNGNLVHFALAKTHLGFYPTPSGIEKFKSDFEKDGYKYSKGAVQFPLNREIPFDLIGKITQFRVKENTKLIY